jgi:hypothetical protein
VLLSGGAVIHVEADKAREIAEAFRDGPGGRLEAIGDTMSLLARPVVLRRIEMLDAALAQFDRYKVEPPASTNSEPEARHA